MRGEWPGPPRKRGVLEDRRELRFQQVWIEEQEERRRGIEDVDRRDAAVGEVLLGEVQEGAIKVRDELVRRQRLAISQHGELRVLRSSCGGQIARDLEIELARAMPQRVIVAMRCLQQIAGR